MQPHPPGCTGEKGEDSGSPGEEFHVHGGVNTNLPDPVETPQNVQEKYGKLPVANHKHIFRRQDINNIQDFTVFLKNTEKDILPAHHFDSPENSAVSKHGGALLDQLDK